MLITSQRGVFLARSLSHCYCASSTSCPTQTCFSFPSQTQPKRNREFSLSRFLLKTKVDSNLLLSWWHAKMTIHLRPWPLFFSPTTDYYRVIHQMLGKHHSVCRVPWCYFSCIKRIWRPLACAALVTVLQSQNSHVFTVRGISRTCEIWALFWSQMQ